MASAVCIWIQHDTLCSVQLGLLNHSTVYTDENIDTRARRTCNSSGYLADTEKCCSVSAAEVLYGVLRTWQLPNILEVILNVFANSLSSLGAEESASILACQQHMISI